MTTAINAVPSISLPIVSEQSRFDSVSTFATADATSSLMKNPASADTLIGGVPPRTTPRRAKVLVPPPPPFAPIHSGTVIDNFRAALDEVNDVEGGECGEEDAFYVCDLAEVWRQARRWKRVLGERVEAFYAVKCNPDPHVIRLFAALGLGFDCASQAEISLVLSLGVPPHRIIYANPCKAASFIRHAAETSVRLMTFDNTDELTKVARLHQGAQMVVRILTDESGSLCKLGEKFGAPLGSVKVLLERAKQLGVDVVGVSFHVGSGCSNPELFRDAVGRARFVFDLAASLGFHFTLLDVGGGFGHDNFEELAGALQRGLQEYFPVDGAGKRVRVIAEPGRYFVAKAFELATNVIARRTVEDEMAVVSPDGGAGEIPFEDKAVVMYYVNDGVYGAFNCIMFDHQVVCPHILTLAGAFQDPRSSTSFETLGTATVTGGLLTPAASEASSDFDDCDMYLSPPTLLSATTAKRVPLEPCKIFGPSCDGIDLICPLAYLPTSHLKVGDWLRWEVMGAYTICAASQFNGFRVSGVRYCVDGKGEGVGIEREVRGLLGLGVGEVEMAVEE